jgi:hypothetical protein
MAAPPAHPARSPRPPSDREPAGVPRSIRSSRRPIPFLAATPHEEGGKMNTTTVRPSVRTTGMNATLRWGLAAIAVGMILGALFAP